MQCACPSRALTWDPSLGKQGLDEDDDSKVDPMDQDDDSAFKFDPFETNDKGEFFDEDYPYVAVPNPPELEDQPSGGGQTTGRGR